MRGEVFPGAVFFKSSRITPACAGRSLKYRNGLYRNEDHPRVCGEKTNGTVSRSNGTGSPPRVRGEVIYGIVCHGKLGITPACAGRRPSTAATAFSVQDHPRVCGEKTSITLISTIRRGSPPRVRGEEYMQHASKNFYRITPACAGRSVATLAAGLRDEDHPRVCGEKESADVLQARREGSPPRVRGEEGAALEQSLGGGITPACAGRSDVVYRIAAFD